MSELSSSAFALICAGRAGLRPSRRDRERVSAALSSRLGEVAAKAAVVEPTEHERDVAADHSRVVKRPVSPPPLAKVSKR